MKNNQTELTQIFERAFINVSFEALINIWANTRGFKN